MGLALGALLLFVSNLVALVLAGTTLFAALGYALEADVAAVRVGAARRTSLTLAALFAAVVVPLGLNTAAVLVLHAWNGDVERVAQQWASRTPGAVVAGVEFSSNAFLIDIRSPTPLASTDGLLEAVEAVVPDGFDVVLDTTYGEEIAVGTTGRR